VLRKQWCKSALRYIWPPPRHSQRCQTSCLLGLLLLCPGSACLLPWGPSSPDTAGQEEKTPSSPQGARGLSRQGHRDWHRQQGWPVPSGTSNAPPSPSQRWPQDHARQMQN